MKSFLIQFVNNSAASQTIKADRYTVHSPSTWTDFYNEENEPILKVKTETILSIEVLPQT